MLNLKSLQQPELDAEPPMISISHIPADLNTVYPGDTIQFTVTATDNTQVQSIGLDVAGTNIDLDEDGKGSYLVLSVGNYTVTATAIDINDNVGASKIEFTSKSPSIGTEVYFSSTANSIAVGGATYLRLNGQTVAIGTYSIFESSSVSSRFTFSGSKRVHPYMTSNTTPAPYSVSATKVMNTKQAAWKALNATNNIDNCWSAGSIGAYTLTYNFGQTLRVSGLNFATGTHAATFVLKGKFENSSAFTTLKSFTQGASPYSVQTFNITPGYYTAFSVTGTTSGQGYPTISLLEFTYYSHWSLPARANVDGKCAYIRVL